MSESITVSKQYGLNPSILQCPCCGKEFGLALFGAGLRDKEKRKEIEAPKVMAIPNQLCDSCKEVIEKKNGIFFIEIKDGEAEKNTNNPYRTGRLVAFAKPIVEKAFGNITSSINYMEHTMFEKCFGHLLKDMEKQKQ